MDRAFDVVLYGATGFTGRQAAAYLAEHAPRGLRLAIGGRSREKLESVARGLPRAVSVIVADSEDPGSVDEMVRQTRVIATTAGPFVKYGEPVAVACVARGTHYCDITGESPWVRTLIDRFHEKAAAEGTRIVPFCGFDSVPSDLGVWMLADHAGPLAEVRSAFSVKGGVNGGTLSSVLDMAERGELRALTDPRLLDPPGVPLPECRAQSRVTWDEAFGRWLAPFVMAGVNTRVVRRSAGLLAGRGQGYGDGFRYVEAFETRSRATAVGVRLGLGLGTGLIATRPGRALARQVVPAPGEGPSEAEMEGGFFRTRFLGTTASGQKIAGIAADRGDPGNRATVKMLSESALCLALDPLAGGGVLTPASAFGRFLLDRLRAAGMTWTVGPLPADGRVPTWSPR